MQISIFLKIQRNLQSEIGVCLLEDPLRVKVVGSEVFGPAHNRVDLLCQFLGLLLQLLMLLHEHTHTKYSLILTVKPRVIKSMQACPHLQQLSTGAQVVTFGSIV